jgi:hypothetical protein
MGMFDDIRCEAALPDDRFPPGHWFQTKSLNCSRDRFTITREGRLIFHKHRYESGPDWEVLPGVMIPGGEAVHVADIDMDYHGDINFCDALPDLTVVDYVARFTNGKLEWIRPYESLSELHKTWFDAKG